MNGPDAHELAEALWQAWLRAGGPWPSEFRLHAAAKVSWEPDHPECFIRKGPRCSQAWELLERRERTGWR